MLSPHESSCCSWEEFFSEEAWNEAFAENGVDPHFYANREKGKDEILPWSVIDCGVREDYLWRERERAYAAETTPDCRTRCSGCGANKMLTGGGHCG